MSNPVTVTHLVLLAVRLPENSTQENSTQEISTHFKHSIIVIYIIHVYSLFVLLIIYAFDIIFLKYLCLHLIFFYRFVLWFGPM